MTYFSQIKCSPAPPNISVHKNHVTTVSPFLRERMTNRQTIYNCSNFRVQRQLSLQIVRWRFAERLSNGAPQLPSRLSVVPLSPSPRLLQRAPAELSALDGCRMTWTPRRRSPRSGPPSCRWNLSQRPLPGRLQRARAPAATFRPHLPYRRLSNRARSIRPPRPPQRNDAGDARRNCSAPEQVQRTETRDVRESYLCILYNDCTLSHLWYQRLYVM